jgi:photosystem II stability/assembly factor-like uncharacterized protein
MFLKLLGGASVLFLLGLYALTDTGSSDRPSGRIDGIVFENPSHGFIEVLTSPRAIYETKDAGRTWRKFELGMPGFRRGRSFADAMNGYSVDESMRDHGKVFKTQNGGVSWVVVFDTRDDGDFVFGGIQAISASEAWAAGITGSYHTLDGGKSWRKEGPAGTGLQFLDGQRGWITGDKLWRTRDGGTHWDPIEDHGKTCFGGLGIFFLDEMQGWSVGGQTEGNVEGGARTGLVTHTADGGKTCQDVASVPNPYFWSVFFLNEHEG